MQDGQAGLGHPPGGQGVCKGGFCMDLSVLRLAASANYPEPSNDFNYLQFYGLHIKKRRAISTYSLTGYMQELGLQTLNPY